MRLASARRRVRWRRLLLLASGGLVSALGILLLRITSNLPSVGHLVTRFESSPSSLLYDSQGQLIARLGGPERHLVPLSDISPNMGNAIIAIEDHSFYHNPGFDLRSILRATYVDVVHHAPLQGASTITEQLAKDLYLSDQKSLTRKVREFLIGVDLARHYSKRQILDMYLNEVYFGQGADGIQAAAHVYFDTSPAKLTMAQATLLAGLPQAPSLYDPLVNFKLAKARQEEVVAAMVRYHDISPAEGRRIVTAPLHLHPEPVAGTGSSYPYPWYVDQVVLELRRHGFTMNQILHGGLHIHTALRPRVYAAAQKQVDQWMIRNFGAAKGNNPAHQAAAVVENPKNGHVWAIIGGRKHFAFLQEDLAVNALRSTGSSIKPLLDYAPALTRGYTQMSVVQDVPIFHNVHGQTWWPSNDDGKYRGYIDLRDALAISDNDAAVHLLDRVGLSYAIRFLQRHFDISPPPGQSKSLGMALGVDTNLLAMTRAYAALDDQGQLRQPVFVTRVTWHGRTLYQPHAKPTQAVTPDQAFILTNMLRRVLDPNPLPSIGPGAYTTGHDLGIGRPAAGKTGTNNNEADAWFIGYEPGVVTGVWEGDQRGEIAQPYTESGSGPAYGAVAAGPIWRQIMTSINTSLKLNRESFPVPQGVTYVKQVSITSGDHPSPITPASEVQGAWFIDGTAPTKLDPSWYRVRVPATDPNTLWQPGCGPFVTITVLKRESDWHPGVPLPLDASKWAPTTTCSVRNFHSARGPGPSPHEKPQKHHRDKKGHEH
ncbi:MAG: transglycosylase domain-containing protein [Thermaerobacter sp.]|nr:transglycosylase domain-containing protein [Thermaerobacter sp.]